MNGEMQEKLGELLSDEEYVKYLLSLGSAEAISDELADHDIDVEPEEVRMIGKLLVKKSDGELSDEDLENVSGGSILAGLVIGGALACFGIIIGAPFAIDAIKKSSC